MSTFSPEMMNIFKELRINTPVILKRFETYSSLQDELQLTMHIGVLEGFLKSLPTISEKIHLIVSITRIIQNVLKHARTNTSIATIYFSDKTQQWEKN